MASAHETGGRRPRTGRERLIVAMAVGGLIAAAARAEPALPAGLGGPASSEPSLPAGLGGAPADGMAEAAAGPRRAAWRPPANVHGFLDARVGPRLRNDPHQDEDASLGEARLQVSLDRQTAAIGLRLVADAVYDGVADDTSIDLEAGRGWLDLRQASLSGTPFPYMDVKLGRQILTWGTGDLLFINDNFPKDWQSFLSGRDVEYLKAPSDAVKASLFAAAANLDVVYTPRFDADRYVSGERLSYYNAGLGRRAGEDAVVRAHRPDGWFDDDELALRLYHNLRAYELALYLYDGFWKSPAGVTPDGRATFPALAVYGASLRGPVAGGIGHLEAGYYDSRDDAGGNDPAVRNSEWRGLAGYERDLALLARDFTVGIQYYVEHIVDYGRYRAGLPAGAPPRDEDRQLVTLRLTKLLLRQNLTLSCFAFYSPSDEDAYLRPLAAYKLNDALQVSLGGNIFLGKEAHTFFGQFEDNNNVYAALRYSY